MPIAFDHACCELVVPRGPPFQERSQLATARRVAQLPQRLGLDLPDTLAGDREGLSDFFQCVLAAVADPKTHLDDALFARRQGLQDRLGLLLQVQVDHRVGGRDHLAILDEIAQIAVFVFPNLRVEGDWLLRDREHLAHLGHRDVHALGDLLGGWFASQLLHERARGPDHLVDHLDHVPRNPDRPRLIGHGPRDRLTDPPGRVRRELIAAPVLKLIDRLDQTDVAFLNQIEQLQTAIRVLLRDGHHQAEVGFDQFFLRLLGLILATGDRVERAPQVFRGLLELIADLLQRSAQLWVPPLQRPALLFLEPQSPAFEMQKPRDVVNLALPPRHPLNLLLDLLDEPPLDQLGERDLADEAGQLYLGAHGLPPGAPVLALLLLGNGLELLSVFLADDARLAHGVDLLQHVARPFLDPVIGHLIILERDELADRALAHGELLPHADDVLGHRRRAGDRLDDAQLGTLDAARDLHFALAREERHGANLAQVHPDRIVGLVERARRQVELQLLGALDPPIELVLLQIRLFRIDDLDPGAAEDVEQGVELVRGRDLGRQQFVDFVVQQVALFLPDGNELPDLVVLFLDRQGTIPPQRTVVSGQWTVVKFSIPPAGH